MLLIRVLIINEKIFYLLSNLNEIWVKYVFITATKEVMFLFVGLFVSGIMEKLLAWFSWSVVKGCSRDRITGRIH